MLDGVCAVHYFYQLVSSLPHQLTSHVVNIIGAGKIFVIWTIQNVNPHPENKKCVGGATENVG